MFLHVPDRSTPFEDTAAAMNDAVRQGKFKKFGVSNYNAAEVKQFIEICEQEGYAKPSVYQGHYNAVVRGAAGGLFSGYVDTSTRWRDDNDIGELYKTLCCQPAVQAAVATVRGAVTKYRISGHAAALRWTAFHSVLDGKYDDAVVFGVSKIEQLHSTLDALEAGPLPDEVAEAITAIYATVEGAEPPYHL
ncbi:NADP-dependent oxidoreductase domain-containing protein [Diplogelasinospora grovesii]|uniref:NADP-dependent oxidoreductase domain-containing protein n=1 Tax=Diplogelasinospora grovesii TaxID=303347 RepID=A0AAN6RZP8_9PEZI|nr:NADP-dependent oxidoreductase domain-containing protein [Diplogelasinospora grovesii]